MFVYINDAFVMVRSQRPASTRNTSMGPKSFLFYKLNNLQSSVPTLMNVTVIPLHMRQNKQRRCETKPFIVTTQFVIVFASSGCLERFHYPFE